MAKYLDKNKYSWLWRYGIAILAVAVATIFKLLLSPIIPVETPFSLYFAAVTVSSFYGGWQVGILATILSALMGDYFFLPPTYTLLTDSFGQMLALGIFISEALLILGIISALREPTQQIELSQKTSSESEEDQAQLANLNAILEQRVIERTSQLEQARDNAQLTLNLLNGIIDGTNDLVMALDKDFRFIAFNSACKQEFTRIFGLEATLGMCVLDAVAHLPQEQAKIREFWGRALQGEQFTIIEDFGDPSLERHYYEINFSSIKDENNQLIGACHLVRNVTERIRAEAQIRKLTQELEQRVIASPFELEIYLCG